MASATILGSGTSNGVPSLGKTYPPEFLADPRNHRTRSSLLLRGPEGNVLVDSTPEMRIQLLRESVLDISAVIITHTHADHIMGMDDLRAYSMKNQAPMPVYTSPRYQDDIRRIFNYAFQGGVKGIWLPSYDLRDDQPVIEEGGLSIQTFWVEHGPWPVMGLRVNRFAYLTDVNHIPEPAMEMLVDLDVLVLDSVRRRPHPNHFHFDQSIEVALEIGARQTYLTHLSDDFDFEETSRELPPGIALAYDGLNIPL